MSKDCYFHSFIYLFSPVLSGNVAIKVLFLGKKEEEAKQTQVEPYSICYNGPLHSHILSECHIVEQAE